MNPEVRALRTPEAIRERCGTILEAGLRGELEHFEVRLDRLDAAAARVARLTRARFPDLRVPYHSRWGHFRAGGIDRVADFDRRLDGRSDEDKGRARFELAITSVLLDAGAGAWSFREGDRVYARSEGLAVASYRAFVGGAFSSDPRDPLRADVAGLRAFDADRLAHAFQVTADNPLVGLAGRASIVQKLGDAVANTPAIFGAPRLGAMFDHLRSERVEARAILAAVLDGLGSIWPGRVALDGVDLGDVWPHPTVGLVPFHKLSQWLTYSLLEPLEWAGAQVVGLDALTGLAEYRNGGLFVDEEVLVARDPQLFLRTYTPGSPAIVEWRALTVALLDRIAAPVRHALGVGAAEFPLAKVLEGGTWHAGREIAQEKRADGGPPIRIESDGTVF